MEQKKFKLIKHESNNYGYIVDKNDVYIQVHAYVIQYIECLQKELDETKLELLKEKENHEIDLQNWSNDLKELEPTYNENEKLKNEIEGLDIEVEFLKDENKELKEENERLKAELKQRTVHSDTNLNLWMRELKRGAEQEKEIEHLRKEKAMIDCVSFAGKMIAERPFNPIVISSPPQKSPSKEKKREYDKTYRAKNSEKVKKRKKDWLQTESGKASKRKEDKKYKKKHKEKISAYNKAWREKNPDYGKKWREAHPDYHKNYNSKKIKER